MSSYSRVITDHGEAEISLVLSLTFLVYYSLNCSWCSRYRCWSEDRLCHPRRSRRQKMMHLSLRRLLFRNKWSMVLFISVVTRPSLASSSTLWEDISRLPVSLDLFRHSNSCTSTKKQESFTHFHMKKDIERRISLCDQYWSCTSFFIIIMHIFLNFSYSRLFSFSKNCMNFRKSSESLSSWSDLSDWIAFPFCCRHTRKTKIRRKVIYIHYLLLLFTSLTIFGL